jgi:uncharacterized membrane protein YdjX (TVP38/TMEM64 family)
MPADPVGQATTPRSWGRIVVLLVIAAAIAGFFILGGQKYVTLGAIKEHRDALLGFTDRHYLLMAVATFVVYTVSTALSLPGGLVLSLTVGLLFGRWAGTAIIVVAATVGATLVFLAARYLFADWARARMGGLAQKLNEGFTQDAFNYMLFLRLVPLFPFWLVNLAPAFTNVSLRTYVIATAIGIIPGSFVFANLGRTLGQIESLQGLLSRQVLMAFLLLGAFALLPIAIKRFRGRRKVGPG